MPVPKTTVHKNNHMVSRQNYIGTTGKLCTVQPKTVAHCMQDSTHQKLRARIAASHALHNEATLFGRARVHADTSGGASWARLHPTPTNAQVRKPIRRPVAMTDGKVLFLFLSHAWHISRPLSLIWHKESDSQIIARLGLPFCFPHLAPQASREDRLASGGVAHIFIVDVFKMPHDRLAGPCYDFLRALFPPVSIGQSTM